MYAIPQTDEEAAYLEWERLQSMPEFSREENRHTKLKRKLDCGHWIDGSEPYYYAVWKDRGADSISQRLECEPCHRQNDASWQ